MCSVVQVRLSDQALHEWSSQGSRLGTTIHYDTLPLDLDYDVKQCGEFEAWVSSCEKFNMHMHTFGLGKKESGSCVHRLSCKFRILAT